jgi:hypothetical protein
VDPKNTPGFTPTERAEVSQVRQHLGVGPLNRTEASQDLATLHRINDRLGNIDSAGQTEEEETRVGIARMELKELKERLDDWMKANPEP